MNTRPARTSRMTSRASAATRGRWRRSDAPWDVVWSRHRRSGVDARPGTRFAAPRARPASGSQGWRRALRRAPGAPAGLGRRARRAAHPSRVDQRDPWDPLDGSALGIETGLGLELEWRARLHRPPSLGLFLLAGPRVCLVLTTRDRPGHVPSLLRWRRDRAHGADRPSAVHADEMSARSRPTGPAASARRPGVPVTGQQRVGLACIGIGRSPR